MIDVFNDLNAHVMKSGPLKTERLPTFYPSAASCLSETDGSVIGACLRSQFYRCAGYTVTNPPGVYSQYIFAAGNMWEDKLTAWFKEMGMWVGNTIKFQDIDRYISGEIDIVIEHPADRNKYIVEAKTYSSSNYQAKKALVGGKGLNPSPKDQNLLQSFLYLGKFAEQVAGTLLIYFDRACGGPENNKQFLIKKHDIGEKSYPAVIATDRDGTLIEYIDKRITLSAIYKRYEDLKKALAKNVMPRRDYDLVYSDEKVESMWSEGKIAKTRYASWQSNPEKNPIGDWQCSWCNYKDLCYSYDK